MNQGEQVESSGTQDLGTAFENLQTAGDALTEMLNPSGEDQSSGNESEIEDDKDQESEEEDIQDVDDQDSDNDGEESEVDNDEEDDGLDLEDDESDEDDQTFKIGDETVTKQQLVEGYMRQADYAKKTEAVEYERQKIETDRKVFENASQQTEKLYASMVNYIQQNLIHPKPDDRLAHQDPAQYNQELALHYQTVQEADKIFSAANQTKDVLQNMNGQINEVEFMRAKEREAGKLFESYPSLRDPSKMQKFEKSINDFAVEIGFTEQEIMNQAPDARVMKILHLARIGQNALKDRKESKRKMGEKPIPKGTSRVSKSDYRSTKNRKAMSKLSRTGTIQDAGAVLGEMLLKS